MTMRAFLAAALIVLAGMSACALDAPAAQDEAADWANIARYRAANGPLVAAPDRQRVVFMGDSISESWAEQPLLRSPHHIGRGIAGQTTPQMLVRFRSDVLSLRPAVLHLMAGTNDVAGNTGPTSDAEILGHLDSMVTLARADGIRVVLAAIPPATRFYWRPELRPAARIAALNRKLRGYASRERLTFVDYGAVLAEPDGSIKSIYSSDSVHLNAAGYAAMAPLATRAIAQALSGDPVQR